MSIYLWEWRHTEKEKIGNRQWKWVKSFSRQISWVSGRRTIQMKTNLQKGLPKKSFVGVDEFTYSWPTGSS